MCSSYSLISDHEVVGTFRLNNLEHGKMKDAQLFRNKCSASYFWPKWIFCDKVGSVDGAETGAQNTASKMVYVNAEKDWLQDKRGDGDFDMYHFTILYASHWMLSDNSDILVTCILIYY